MNCRLAFLTNFIPPYRVPVLKALAPRFSQMRMMVSTPMEPDRSWRPDWTGLDVVVQKTITITQHEQSPSGFKETRSLHFPLDTVKRLKTLRAGVVISAEMGFRTLMALFYRKLNRRSRLIVWADVAEATEKGRGWVRIILRRLFAKTVDRFIVNGESGARCLARIGVDQDRVFRIPYTVEISRFASHPLIERGEHARRLLYVGRLIERKGLAQFLGVLCKWGAANPGYEIDFVLVGDGPLRAALERIATPASVRVTLLGSVPYNDIPEVYSSADVLVLPTLADTWGLVVNEGMATGLPVLGSIYSQAVQELVKDGENGWLFRADNPAEIYDAIDRCIRTSSSVFGEMRQRARKAAISLTPDYVAGLIQNAVNTCARERPRPRLAILTNLVAPYRRKLYEDIADEFETYVLTGGQESNRGAWDHVPGKRFGVKRCWGITFPWPRRSHGRIYDFRYFHLRPGYLLDLFKLRPDVVISSEMGLRSCFALLYGYLLSRPVWIWWGGTMHTELHRIWLKKSFRSVFARVVRRWISYGASSTEYLASLGIPRNRILQIQNCVDESLFQVTRDTLPAQNEPFKFLFVGRLVAGKGVEQLLDAFAKIQKIGNRATLTLVGEGPERPRLEALAYDLGLRDISFAGAAESDRLVDFYRNVDCLVVPTLEDVWGLVVNEAIWAGVPVLCSKYAGAAHEILPPENIFDPLDRADLVRALKRTLNRRLGCVKTGQLRTTAEVAKQITTALLNEVA